MAFWHRADDGLWHQKRLDEVRGEVFDKVHKARASAQARWLKYNNTGDANASATAPQNAMRRQSGRNANQSQSQIDSHGGISTVAPRASAPDGARAPADDAKWDERLAAYEPWNGKRTWQPFWGLPPDSPGHNPLIPADKLAAWKARRDAAMRAAA
jgi:hypothetical protein